MLKALTWAACKGHMKICKVLVDNGADPAKQTMDGSTAAEIAEIHSQMRVSLWQLNLQISLQDTLIFS